MQPKIKRLVYFEGWVDSEAERILRAQAGIDLVRLEYAANQQDIWPVMASAHGYQIQPRTELRSPWFGDVGLLKRCPHLLAICSTGAGHDVIDVEACTAAGVIVCNQSGTNKEAVAQHALGFMLSLSKKIAISDKSMRQTIALDRYALTGNDLTGKTVGVVGIGRIGARLAELCSAFGMTVVAYDPYLEPREVSARGARKVDLDELLQISDFVSVHCPRSSETLDMFGAEEFAKMKPSAYFINTARGGIHNERHLTEAIGDGRIAGAAIDVFLREPPPIDHPLLQLDNVIVTPHIAGITFEALQNMAVAAAQQWIAIFSGAVPPRLVNPEVWPRYASRFEEAFGFAPAKLCA